MFQVNTIGLFTKIATSIVVVGLILNSGCGGKALEMQSQWSAESIKVDGQVEDWSDTPLTYFEDEQVSLGLRNDDENLYILFCTRSQTWERLIRMSGVTMWLDETGGKKKDFGIRYIGGPSLSEMQKSGMLGEGGFRDSLIPELKQRLIREREIMANQIEVLLEEGKQEIIIPADGSRGPAVSSAVPRGIYTYEFCIPLREKHGDYYFIKPQPPQKTLGIGLEWGGIGTRDRQRMTDEVGGERGSVGGGMPRGGMPGGERGGMRERQIPQKQETWIKVHLAQPR
ncbi:MAG: hypothetical protein COT45_02870 [bacterium (Candidatus Stahlbacteria) CG08_land_8_20_14_0_20_40_26]|nr:MAG: hypothetical protein COT45_02870 [bacterium (Candidatus Stahlbacteria) CG08_land_8_20_14_0_20_40_26]